MAYRKNQNIEVSVEVPGLNLVEIFLQKGNCPTWNNSNASIVSHGNGYIKFTDYDNNGTLYIGVRGYSNDTYTLRTSCEGQATECALLWPLSKAEKKGKSKTKTATGSTHPDADGD